MKYRVSYKSGATGFGWTNEFDTIKEVKMRIEELIRNTSAAVFVYDNELEDFVFYKFAGSSSFNTDLIFNNRKADLRTKNRMAK